MNHFQGESNMTLKRGSKGFEVRLLQKGLAIFGKTVTNIKKFDGDFGPATELAVKNFQKENKLPMTGIYDDATKAILGPRIDYMFIRYEDMIPYAKDINVEPAALQAVYKIESKGDGFYYNAKPVILYEGHIFYRLIKQKYGTEKANELARKYPTICYPTWTTKHYIGGVGEHTRLEKALELDSDCALQSASWGLFQIMGFNYKAAGYTTLRSYINAMHANEHEQFNAGVNFIAANATMLKALRNKNWSEFARLYNGPGYATNQYHTKLEAMYKQLSNQL